MPPLCFAVAFGSQDFTSARQSRNLVSFLTSSTCSGSPDASTTVSGGFCAATSYFGIQVLSGVVSSGCTAGGTPVLTLNAVEQSRPLCVAVCASVYTTSPGIYITVQGTASGLKVIGDASFLPTRGVTDLQLTPNATGQVCAVWKLAEVCSRFVLYHPDSFMHTGY